METKDSIKDSVSSTKCLNCEHEFTGQFCPNCGQSSRVQRITFRETFSSILSSTFSLEGRLPYTIFQLFKNPGNLFREFLSGKRTSYYKPVAFFVVTTAIYLIIRKLLNFDPLEGQFEQIPSGDKPEFVLVSQRAARFMVNNINNIMFLLVFSIAFIMKLFFRKRYNLAEYTSIGFFITGMYVLLGVLFIFVNKYSPININNFQLLFLIALILFCSISFFKARSFLLVFKCILISFLSTLLYLILGFGLSYLITYFFP